MTAVELSAKTLERFYDICQIPRCSGNEKAIGEWLLNWGKGLNLQAGQDEAGNVIISVPGKNALKEAPIVVIQGHMDMVCVKETNSGHNFCTDPIDTYIEDGWLKAKNTTLGADNGIAIAIAMALTEDQEIDCPPLELLFTVDEERGLTGANQLQPGTLRGKYLLNIDSEEEGEFTIGCAGGKDTHIEMDLNQTELEKGCLIEININGLTGGHSGMEINQNRANAIILTARMLHHLRKETFFHLVTIKGGIAHNAIPRDCYTVLAVTEKEKALQSLAQIKNILENEYKNLEKSLNIDISVQEEADDEWDCLVYDNESTIKTIQLMMIMPHGVTYMSEGSKDLVETSNNFAKIMTEANLLKIQTSQRSSVSTRNDYITARVESAAEACGARAVSGNGYPSWQPDWNSGFLKKCQTAYQKLFNKDPKINVIHAGLECGIIGAKFEGMEMISIGPNIRTPHSPQERMEVASIEKIIAFILALFKEL